MLPTRFRDPADTGLVPTLDDDPLLTEPETEPEPAPDPEDGAGFLGLGLDARLVVALSALGYEEPTDIQREAIPSLLAGRDILA
jgi:ATP-dependent RNA helicase DeaD